MLVPKDDPFGIRTNYRATQYQAAMNEALAEREQISIRLREIEQERVGHEERMKWLNETIAALIPLCNVEIQEQEAPKIGAICYHTLLNLNRPATAPELRLLIAQHIDLSRYQNPLAVIHMALKRMPDKVNYFKGSDGRGYYAVIDSHPYQVIDRHPLET
jgi:hypothetical protein